MIAQLADAAAAVDDTRLASGQAAFVERGRDDLPMKKWRARRESNPRPTGSKPVALSS
jgi:hypothetical protein